MSTKYEALFENLKFVRNPTARDWDDVEKLFISNFDKSVEAILHGKPQLAPFVRKINLNGNVKKPRLAFAFGYGEGCYAFPNRFLKPGELVPANDDLVTSLKRIRSEEDLWSALLADLKAAFEKKSDAGKLGIAKRRENKAQEEAEKQKQVA